ncbi:MAG: acetolactate synthase catalytic subunit [Rhodospirillales bacterium]
MPRLQVADLAARALQRHGIEIIFAQSLPSALVLACEALGIRQIAYRQENMGGAMADGYARRSGRIPVVCAQNGPAATLLVPPLAEALKASVPLVALVQDVERPQVDCNAFQEFDHPTLFASCAKWCRRLPAGDRIEDYIDAAFVAAGSGRPGPAVLLLPADLLREEVEALSKRAARHGTWPLDRLQPAPETLAQAVAALRAARTPVIVAGGGAAAGDAAEALRSFQARHPIPVFTTNMGKGAVVETHPLSAGVLGSLTGPKSLGRHSRALLRKADLVLLIGTRTNQNGTDSWRLFAEETRFIHIDIDPQEIGRSYEALRLVGDARSVLLALNEALQAAGGLPRNAQAEGEIAAAWAAFEAERAPLAASTAQPIRPEAVMRSLQACLPDQATLVADASYSSMWLVGQVRATHPGQRFLTPRGLAGLGWGLPLAIGAQLAAPSAKTLVLVGDGGFAHSWAELETLVRCRIPLTILLLNNGVLGYQKDAEAVKFGRYTSACHFAPVDHAMIAAGCGCRALQIRDPALLDAALSEAIAAEEPVLVEIFSDPEAHPPLSLFDGTLDRD